ncbi:MAG TPA: hypothetical protein VIG33_07825 [Pseudobdellovibrionaceae bacterium]
MEKLFFCLSILTAISANATSEVQTQVLAALIMNSGTIAMVDPTTNKPLGRDEQIPALFAKALLQNYTEMGDHGGTLSSITITCDESDKVLKIGTAYKCSISIGQGDFTKTESTMTGPETEGQILFDIDVVKPFDPKAKIIIKNKTVSVEYGD